VGRLIISRRIRARYCAFSSPISFLGVLQRQELSNGGFSNAYDRLVGGPLRVFGARGLLPSRSGLHREPPGPSSFEIAIAGPLAEGTRAQAARPAGLSSRMCLELVLQAEAARVLELASDFSLRAKACWCQFGELVDAFGVPAPAASALRLEADGGMPPPSHAVANTRGRFG